MTPLERELLSECRAIAELTLHNYDSAPHISEIWSTEDRENLAQAYFDHAKSGLELVGTEHDPRIVLRAVRYLAGHAMPPMRDRTDWFREGLLTLLSLACPHSGTLPDGEPFFADIRKGISQAEEWGREENEKT